MENSNVWKYENLCLVMTIIKIPSHFSQTHLFGLSKESLFLSTIVKVIRYSFDQLISAPCDGKYGSATALFLDLATRFLAGR